MDWEAKFTEVKQAREVKPKLTRSWIYVTTLSMSIMWSTARVEEVARAANLFVMIYWVQRLLYSLVGSSFRCAWEEILIQANIVFLCLHFWRWICERVLLRSRKNVCYFEDVGAEICINHRSWPIRMFYQFFASGPLHNPVTMVRNKLCWAADNTVGLSKQGTRTSRARLFSVLEVPLCYLRPSIIYSVPCDRIMQRANQCPCNCYRRSWAVVSFCCNFLEPPGKC